MLLAALALAAAQPVAEAPADNEITVVANRLRNWRGTWRMNKGAATCKTKRSTGDKAIDGIGCDAMIQCMVPLAPRFSTIENAKLPKAEKEQRINALLAAEKVYDCLFAKREAGIAALVAERRSKRS
ncbi:hypothetical protein [Erythrobacter sp. WG]|uniref:hypothetical protein n=1 Tax=Erythrobacter sp. WG TaxID=2985510 RepID=UPI00227026FD|nr:hypothetical protein [Erythrobacter sp. WG]MCX9147557.1 hypothetical protein [Erythrobacter sp. WG]